MEDILRQPGNYELILNDGTNFNIISHGNGIFDYSDNDDDRFADTNDYYTMMWNIEDYNDSDIVQIISNGIMLYDRTPTGAINLIKRKYRARNFRQRARSGFVKNKALGQILLAPEKKFNPNFPGGVDYQKLMKEMTGEFSFGKRTSVKDINRDINYLLNFRFKK